jgi:hypothetical protein
VRITIRIEDDLHRKIKKRARLAVVNDAIRRALRGQGISPVEVKADDASQSKQS